MNINMIEYRDRRSDDSLDEDIAEHHEILGMSSVICTGEVALITPGDPAMARTGALQVWSKTAEGMWVWIDPDGNLIETACPLGD